MAAGASWHATRWSCSRRRSVCAERAANRDEPPALLSARIHSGGAPPREWRAAKRKYLSGRRLTTWNDNPSTLWINFNEINFTNFQLSVCGNTKIRAVGGGRNFQFRRFYLRRETESLTGWNFFGRIHLATWTGLFKHAGPISSHCGRFCACPFSAGHKHTHIRARQKRRQK